MTRPHGPRTVAPISSIPESKGLGEPGCRPSPGSLNVYPMPLPMALMKYFDWLCIVVVLTLVFGVIYTLVSGHDPVDFSHAIYLGL